MAAHGGTGALRNMSGNNTYTGGITLGAATTIGSDADLLTISGPMATSSYAATFTGAGSTQVSGIGERDGIGHEKRRRHAHPERRKHL